ncbi:hypothetical protein D3C81_1861780 [compost metagenome]
MPKVSEPAFPSSSGAGTADAPEDVTGEGEEAWHPGNRSWANNNSDSRIAYLPFTQLFSFQIQPKLILNITFPELPCGLPGDSFEQIGEIMGIAVPNLMGNFVRTP